MATTDINPQNTSQNTTHSILYYGEQETDPYKHVNIFIHMYVLPAIIIFGLCGNLMSSYAFFQKGLRNISSSVYVQAVLFSDTGVLISLIFVWFEILGYRANGLPVVCQFLVYWAYICTFLSIWYVVCITVENYITICHPMRIKELCTVKRATIVTLSLAFFALSAYLVSAFTSEVQIFNIGGKDMPFCAPMENMHDVASMLTKIDIFVTLLIPLILISLMLFGIFLATIKTLRSKRKRSVAKSSKSKIRTSSIPQVRVAKMLAVLSITFIILSAPSHVAKLYFAFLRRERLRQVSFTERFVMQTVLQFVNYLNFSVKFILFYTCSENFRKSYVCFKKHEREGTYRAITTNTQNNQTQTVLEPKG